MSTYKFCHIKYTISFTGKPDKEDKNMYLIDQVREEFNRTLSILIIRNK